MKSAITISLVNEARGGPFVFWDDLERSADRAAALGFDAIEVFAPDAETLKRAGLEAVLRRTGLKLAGLGSGAGWLKHRLRFCDPDAVIRQRAEEFAASLVEAGAAFGAPVVVGSMQGRWEGSVSRDQALGWLGEALGRIAARAPGEHAAILIEPLNRYETNVLNTVSDAARFAREVAPARMRVLADLFHMNIEESDLGAALRACGSQLGHVHLADSNRHAAGFGHTDILGIFRALREMNYQGYVSAEALPLPDSETAATQTLAMIKACSCSLC